MFLELAKLLPRTHLRVILAGPDVPQRLDGVQSTFQASQMLSAVMSEPASDRVRHASSGTRSACSKNESDQASAKTLKGRGDERRTQPQVSETAGSLHLCFRRGMGHDLQPALAAQYGHIDLVFGPNAGASKCTLMFELLNSADIGDDKVVATPPLKMAIVGVPDDGDHVLAGLAAYASWAPTLDVLARPGGPICVFTDFCEEAAIRGAELLAFISANAGATKKAPHVSWLIRLLIYLPLGASMSAG